MLELELQRDLMQSEALPMLQHLLGNGADMLVLLSGLGLQSQVDLGVDPLGARSEVGAANTKIAVVDDQEFGVDVNGFGASRLVDIGRADFQIRPAKPSSSSAAFRADSAGRCPFSE